MSAALVLHTFIATLFRLVTAIAAAAAAWQILIPDPIWPSTLKLGVAVYAVALALHRQAWLLLLPAVIAVVDLVPHTGRIFLNEFDILVLITIAVQYGLGRVRLPAVLRAPWLWLITAVFAWQQVATAVLPALPLPALDVNNLGSYYSPLNSLRVGKGFIYALLFIPIIAHGLARPRQFQLALAGGMLIGAAAVILSILWEREVFTGILNLGRPYRITGMFSGMHIGGAFVDGFVIACLPFALAIALSGRRLALRIVAAGLALGLAYCLFVAYSRTNYPAGAVVLAVLAAGYLAQLRLSRRTVRAMAVAVAAAGVGIVIILSGSNYISSRFATVFEDFGTRIEHWQSVIDLADQDARTRWLGHGKGAYPRRFFVSTLTGRPLSTYQHVSEADGGFLRFGITGRNGTLFVRQRLHGFENGVYKLSLRMRAPNPEKARLLVEFCERHIIYTIGECTWTGLNTKHPHNKWRRYTRKFTLKYARGPDDTLARPIEISILNRGLSRGLDIDQVSLVGPSGFEMIRNGGFEQGLDYWFPSSNDHLAFHVKNIWLDAWFDGGWAGMILFLAFLAAVAAACLRGTRAGDRQAVVLAAAVAGMLVVGTFDSIFDEPRISLIFYLLCFTSIMSSSTVAAHKPASRRRRSSRR